MKSLEEIVKNNEKAEEKELNRRGFVFGKKHCSLCYIAHSPTRCPSNDKSLEKEKEI